MCQGHRLHSEELEDLCQRNPAPPPWQTFAFITVIFCVGRVEIALLLS